MVLASSSFGDAAWCNSMLCHFFGRSKWWNQLSSQVMMFNKKSSFPAACCWSNCDDTSCVPFFGHLSAVGEPSSEKLYYLLHGTVSNAKPCYDFLNCHPECITYAHILWWWFLVNHCKTGKQCPCCFLWSVSPNIAHYWHHAGISKDTMKSVSDVWSRIVLCGNHSMLAKWYSIYSGLWISIGADVLDLYFRLQKTYSYRPYNP
jgi:hypothetical protein